MTALIIIIPILIVAGAFMWLKPSQRDQHLAKLRASAMGQGFRISSLKVPDLSEFGRVNQKKEIVTVYERGLRLVDGEHPQFTVVRTTGEAGTFLPEGWAWDKRVNLTDVTYTVIAEKLASMPASVQLLCLMTDAIGMSWDEKDPKITMEWLTKELSDLAYQFNRATI